MAGSICGPIAWADLVHLHSNGLLIDVAGVVARRLRKPTVVTLYGTDVWHYDAVRHKRFRTVVLSAAHRIFYSRALLEHARPRGLAPDPSSVIYAPVDRSFHAPTDRERQDFRRKLVGESSRVIVTVKRLHPVGGHRDLVAAMPEVLRRYPDAQLVLVGDGELRTSLEAQVRDRELQHHIRFAGVIDNQALWQYYAAADLFVLPSHLESWGTVMLEALACETPVVASDTPGAQEVHSHFPEAVTLFETGNAPALAGAVTAALDRPSRTGEPARRLLAERFSPATCAARYRAVYEEARAARA